MSKKSILVINGNHYDARSGELLKSTSVHTVSGTKVRAAAVRQPVLKPHSRTPAHHTAAHTPKPSSTLMRRAVKKPVPSHSRTAKAHAPVPAASVAKPFGTVVPKPSFTELDSRRLRHAKQVNKSQLVSRFSPDLFKPTSRPAVQPATAPMPRTVPVRSKPKTTAELLEYALAQATAHRQERHPAPRRGLFKRRTRSASA